MGEVPVGITMGDPAGIGPEIVVAAMAGDHVVRAIVIGDLGRLREAAGIRGLVEVDFHPIERPAEARWEPGTLNVVDLGNVPRGLPWGQLSPLAGKACYEYLERAVKLASSGEIAAVCTAPINKEAWRAAGIQYPGHTEALAELTGTRSYAMMLVNEQLRVIHLSTHASLIEAVGRATTQRCVDCIRLTHDHLTSRAQISKPKIAVAGINPHAGENGLLGNEDREQLQPAVAEARRLGIDASGPWPADTIFARAAEGEFDAVIAAYHDQGHIPIKMIGLDTGVNITIGLPIVRTSVDHGTAFDIAGSGVARPANLLAALALARHLSG